MTDVLFIYQDGRILADQIADDVVAAPTIEQAELDPRLWGAKVRKFRRTSPENEQPILYEEYDWTIVALDVPGLIAAVKALPKD